MGRLSPAGLDDEAIEVAGIAFYEGAFGFSSHKFRSVGEMVLPLRDGKKGIVDDPTLFNRLGAEEPALRAKSRGRHPGAKPGDSQMDRRNEDHIKDGDPERRELKPHRALSIPRIFFAS